MKLVLLKKSLSLGGFNVYSYAPNPNNWVDPLGLSPKKDCNVPKREPEIVENFSSFEAARTRALQLIGPLVPGNEKTFVTLLKRNI
ncbi:hypothetical protein WAH95_11905 [Acinetobacter baumannii]